MKNSLKGLVVIISFLLAGMSFVLLCCWLGISFFLGCVGGLTVVTLIGLCWLIGDTFN